MRRRQLLSCALAAPIASLASLAARAASASPARIRASRADVLLPSSFAHDDGAFDLVIHFHGLLTWQEPAFERAAMRAALASVNLGEGSASYERAFRAGASALDDVIASVARALSPVVGASARAARVALSGWSAGFGAVGALLASTDAVKRIDAVLLEDGLHTSYVGHGEIDRATLAKYARFADLAIQREKLFGFTHSAVRAPGYASTSECAAALLAMTGVPRGPPARDALGARALYVAERGAFSVAGFDGGDVEAHRNHVRRFDETLLPKLRARWSR